MRSLFLAGFVIALCADIACGSPPVWIEQASSPDGKMLVEARAWLIGATGNYCEVTVHAGSRVLYHDVFQPDRDVRYFKFSWSPDSRALLIGEGYKPGMDLTLIRFEEGKARATHFDSDKNIDAVLLDALPFREDIKSSAPVGSVTWRSVNWSDHGRCEMTYFFHGIGHEGEAALRIDWRNDSPELKILKISPTIAVKNRRNV